MVRKPKTQPSPDDAAPVPEPAAPDEAAAPPRRGRKARAAALSFASPPAADVSSPATDDAGADAPKAGSAKAPGRKGPGRKPKQAADAGAAPSLQNGAAGPQGQAPGQPEAEAGSGLTGGEALAAAAVPQAGTAADSNPVQPARDPVSDAARSVPETEASVPAAPAAHWDRATDRVRFDWPTIGRVGVALKNGRESTLDGTNRERDQAASAGRDEATAPRSGLNPSGPKVPSAPQR